MAFRPVLILVLAAYPALGQTDLDQALAGFEDSPEHQEHDGIDLVLEGFDTEPAPGSMEQDEAGAMPPWFRVGGTLSQRIIVNFAHGAPPPPGVDHRGLSSLRLRLDLEVSADLGSNWRAHVEGHAWFDLAYRARGRGGYSPEFLDTYEREVAIGEAFLQGPLSQVLDLTFGRQIVVWGRSDHFRVTDVLNPLDNRLPGMTDIEDLRLPVAMSRFDLYADPWSVSMIAIPERRFDKRPVLGSDFFAGTAPLPPRDVPDDTLGAPELAVALTGTFPGWDISLYAANIFDDRPHIESYSAGGRRLRHNRISMVGAAGNVVRGSWLLKAEAAAFTGLRFTNVTDRKFSRLVVLAGVEYSGFADTSLAFEAVNSHILDFDDRLTSLPDDRRRNEPATALRVSRSFRNNIIDVTLLALNFGLTGEHGAIQRLQVGYDLTDAVDLTTGLVFYNSGDQAPFRGLGENDRFFFKLDHHF